MTRAAEAIRLAGGRATALRVGLLAWLEEHGGGVSQREVETACGELGDRVSLYRALDWFVAHGLVHQVSTPGRATVYACGRAIPHIHFTCRVCGRSECLGEAEAAPALPSGYEAETMEVVFTGRCAACR